MTREEVRELLPIMQALAEGKTIQDKIEGLTDWVDTDEINLEYYGQKLKHRIKPESKYRPFKTKEECWDEMHKHPDFGWLYYKEKGYYVNINAIGDRIGMNGQKFVEAFSDYTFTDGIPFGIKED